MDKCFKFFNTKTKKKESLIKRITSEMEIPFDCTYIVFATEDEYNKVEYRTLHKLFSENGFYINKAERPDFYDSNNTNPEELDVIIKNRDVTWDHLVWISKSTCEEKDIRFAWIYAHELQHLKQYQKNPYILLLADYFRKTHTSIPHDKDFHECGIPTEYECEFKADEMVKEKLKDDFFKKNEYEEYKEKRINNKDSWMERFSELKPKLGTIDIEEQMVQLICKHPDKFKSLQANRFQPGHIGFDFGKLCHYSDNPHKAIIESVIII